MSSTPKGFSQATYSGPENEYDADAARAAVARAWKRTHSVPADPDAVDPADPNLTGDQ